MRGERQLLRLGEYLVGRAGRRLPQDIRAERSREWMAELPAILHDPQVRFAPWRAVRMLGYAADTLRDTDMTPGATSDPVARLGPVPGLLFLALFLAEAVLSVWVIAQAPGDAQNYLQLAWSLLLAACFTSSLVHAPARMTVSLMFGSALALEVLGVWDAVQAPADWVNYFDVAGLGLVLLAALLVAALARWFPRLLPHAKRA
jgi:hypothetical protein